MGVLWLQSLSCAHRSVPSSSLSKLHVPSLGGAMRLIRRSLRSEYPVYVSEPWGWPFGNTAKKPFSTSWRREAFAVSATSICQRPSSAKLSEPSQRKRLPSAAWQYTTITRAVDCFRACCCLAKSDVPLGNRWVLITTRPDACAESAKAVAPP
eukprot:7385748-Prymnesium_polylepis.1